MFSISRLRQRWTARILYLRALSALEAHDLVRARLLADRALAVRPGQADCHWIAGTAAQQAGDLDAAAEHLRTAWDLQPHWTGFGSQLATVRYQQERWEEAATLFAACHPLPQHQYAHARCLLELGRYAEAVGIYEELSLARPSDFAVRFDLAVCYFEESRAEDALACYRAIARYQSQRPGLHYNLAQVLCRLGRRAEAITEARAAVAADPTDPDGHTLLGRLLLEDGQNESAMACYQRAAELTPGCAAAHVNLAYAWTAQAALEAAEAEYRRALKLDGGSADAFYGLALLAWQRDDVAVALTYACKAQELRPSDSDQALLLGELYEAAGDFGAARRYFAEAADLGAEGALERLRRFSR